MRFAVVGLSHHTAPIAVRERFAKALANMGESLQAVLQVDLIEEACVVSTCNRVEFYLAGPAEPRLLAQNLVRFMETASGLPLTELEPHIYRRDGAAGLRHLFRVSSSLDSMVIGEPQILGQVKEAYQLAEEHQTLGPALTRIFQRAFSIAKRVRSETGIAENAVSMSFAAVELGREIFDSLAGKQVLLVGAGKMSTLAAKHLQSYGVTEVRVVSRRLETATKLAHEIGGSASSFNDLSMLLNQADIVISSTAAPGFVVDRAMMSKVVRARRYRPILFVDIAVPRDVDPAVSELDNVFVYDVDDLKSVLDSNRDSRAKEAADAEALIESELERFVRWSRSQEVVPVIKALRNYAEDIVSGELSRSVSGINDPKAEKRMRSMGQSIVNKMLHSVMVELKREGSEGDPGALCESLQKLFPINPEAFRTDDLLSSDLAKGTDEADENVLRFRPKEQDG